MAVEELLGAIFSNWFTQSYIQRASETQTVTVVRQENVAMSPAGLGTKNYCAGEDQQQFPRITNQTFASELHDSQNHEKVKYGHESHMTWSQE
jgi:hypothetical protein